MKSVRHACRVAAAIAALASADLFGSTAVAQVNGPKIEWNMSTFGRPRAGMANVEAWSKVVSDATGGNFAIKLHYGETLSPAKENIDGLKIGAFETAVVVASYHPGKLPVHNIFDLPFLPLGDLNVQARVMQRFFALPEATADMARWDVVNFMPLLLPAYEITGKGTPPKVIADLKTKRIRATGGMGEVMRRLGSALASMPSPELYGALERGMVDAIVTAHYVQHSFKLYEVADWYSTNLDLGINSAAVPISLKAWTSLPSQYKNLLKDSVMPAMKAQIDAYGVAQAEAIDAFKKKGMTAVTFDPADRDAFVKAYATQVWDEWIADMDKRGVPGRKLLDFVLAEAAKGGS